MPELRTADPDRATLTLNFGLLMTDAFTKAPGWQGVMSVTIGGLPASGPYLPIVKREMGAFLFHDLPAGNYTFQIRSDLDTPYYLPIDVVVTLPFGSARWPVFPDIALADRTLRLDDPAQPVAYRAQRVQATLQPTTAYPFPAGATLLRGTVASGGNKLAGASIRRASDNVSTATNPQGEYVLHFPSVAGVKQTFALTATHTAHGTASKNVEIMRETTTVADFILP